MNKEYRLTTPDNEYSPFSQFAAWYLRDIELGHNTCSRLARLTANDDPEDEEALNDAMNKMIDLFVLDEYYKVERS